MSWGFEVQVPYFDAMMEEEDFDNTREERERRSSRSTSPSAKRSRYILSSDRVVHGMEGEWMENKEELLHDTKEDSFEDNDANDDDPLRWWLFLGSIDAVESNSTTTTTRNSPNAIPPSQSQSSVRTSGMLISEHLGDTSSMVESLTRDMKSWSLISTSTTTRTTKSKNKNNRTTNFNPNISENPNDKTISNQAKKEQQPQHRRRLDKASKNRVMMKLLLKGGGTGGRGNDQNPLESPTEMKTS